MNTITERIWIGDYEDSLGDLSSFSALANVQDNEPPNRRWERGPYLYLPVEDAKSLPDNAIDEFIYWMRGCLFANRKVFVHCLIGKSRAPGFVAAYLMKSCGFDWDTAITLIKDRRPIVDPHPDVARSVIEYGG